MSDLIKNKLIQLKKQLNREGFHIIGYFGSYSRNEMTEKSDLDILYELSVPFFLRYPDGFSSVMRLQEIKSLICREFNLPVDIVDKSVLSETGKKYILPELTYVDS